MDYSPPGSSTHWIFPGKSTGVGCHCLLQGIFTSQGLNPGLPHCRLLSHRGSPFHAKWLCNFHFYLRLNTVVGNVYIRELILGKKNPKDLYPYLVEVLKYNVFKKYLIFHSCQKGLPQWLDCEESSCNAVEEGSVPRSGRPPGGGPDNPLHCSCWSIPGTEEPGRLQSTGWRRVRRDWSDLTQHSTKMSKMSHKRLHCSLILWFIFCCLSFKQVYFKTATILFVNFSP